MPNSPNFKRVCQALKSRKFDYGNFVDVCFSTLEERAFKGGKNWLEGNKILASMLEYDVTMRSREFDVVERDDPEAFEAFLAEGCAFEEEVEPLLVTLWGNELLEIGQEALVSASMTACASA